MKFFFGISVIMLALCTPSIAISEKECDHRRINTRWTGNLNIMGFNLGEQLRTTNKKADLFLENDFHYVQYFSVPSPKKSIRSITLGYVKSFGLYNNLYYIQISYPENSTTIGELISQLPYSVIEKKNTVYPFEGSFKELDPIQDKINIDVNVKIGRADGGLWLSYTLSETAEELKAIEDRRRKEMDKALKKSNPSKK